MNEAEFQTQVNRLVETFGKPAYGTERCRLIWREVATIPAQSFAAIVDELIGTCRQAPLLPEFREASARVREVIWREEKRVHTADAERAMKDLFGPEDIAMICKGIRDRINGNMDDQKFIGFTRMLNDFPRAIRCTKCDGTGYQWERGPTGGEVVWRCPCPVGQQKPRAIAVRA